MDSVEAEQPEAIPSSPPSYKTELIHVFWHEGMLKHDTGKGVFDTGMDPGFLDVLENHPENSDRIRNMVSILKRGPISPFISWHVGRPAQISELLTFHTQEYINELVEADREGGKMICAGTFLNPGSWDCALLAAGTTLSAMKHIIDGCGKISYALVRPPGHHAQPNQEGFYHSDEVLTISLHMNHGSWGPSHPQSGTVDELGEGKGFGYNLNIPLPNGTGDRGYDYAMRQLVVPAVEKFKPDMLVLVIGEDSSAFDPNGRQCLTMDGYRVIGQTVRGLADKHSHGCLLIVQEGGYHVTYSAYCLHAILEGVLKIPVPLLSDPIAYYPEDEAFSVKVIESIKDYQINTVPFL
ncbi:histone deacetylase 8 isoform X2 [Coffea arabica]|uniref:Histone deacetylase 8 isoform X2 n=1 Tax=Coffea arabica TaxID=13443 RepID=A0ABM4V0T6_COFAR|nr:histone deacetylase 8 isoform X2 [Coffea arabica]